MRGTSPAINGNRMGAASSAPTGGDRASAFAKAMADKGRGGAIDSNRRAGVDLGRGRLSLRKDFQWHADSNTSCIVAARCCSLLEKER